MISLQELKDFIDRAKAAELWTDIPEADWDEACEFADVERAKRGESGRVGNQTTSNVNCHNGDVYRLEKIKQVDNIDALITDVYNDNVKNYGSYGKNRVEYETSMTVINVLTRSRHLKFISR